MSWERALGACLTIAIAGCSFVTGGDIGNGIGESCGADSDCQGSSCVGGVCTLSCGAPADCPAPAICLPSGTCGVPSGNVGEPCASNGECTTGQCFDGLCTKSCTTSAECPEPSQCFGNLCQLPLSVGFIWVGVVEDEGWTLTHDQGRIFAEQQLPYLQTDLATNVFLPEVAEETVDQFIADGRKVIVANSFSLRDPIRESSEEHPDTQFLTCSANVTSPNLGSYFARSYQSWYLAGYAAAQKSQTNRLGFVGSYVTPEVVRHINAFALGARRLKPTIEVEVRWEGFWFDLDPPNAQGKYRETVLTEELIETGCDVIGHNSDVGRTVVAVEKAFITQDVYSIGNDNIDACDRGPNSCIGTAYWNWGPQYVQIFSELHKGTWDPTQILNENIKVNPAESVTYFRMNDNVVSQDLKINVGEILADLAKPGGIEVAFRGPYDTTGQRDPPSIGAGEVISDEELGTMCWFVEGVIEKEDPDDPTSGDKPALVPVGDVEIPPGSGNKPDCRVNQ